MQFNTPGTTSNDSSLEHIIIQFFSVHFMYESEPCLVLFVQAVCLAACKKLHEMGTFTDTLLPDRGSGEGEKTEQNDEGDPLPGTARHREFFPEGVADILQVSVSFSHYLSLNVT